MDDMKGFFKCKSAGKIGFPGERCFCFAAMIFIDWAEKTDVQKCTSVSFFILRIRAYPVLRDDMHPARASIPPPHGTRQRHAVGLRQLAALLRAAYRLR
jgi:hypothetical protein